VARKTFLLLVSRVVHRHPSTFGPLLCKGCDVGLPRIGRGAYNMHPVGSLWPLVSRTCLTIASATRFELASPRTCSLNRSTRICLLNYGWGMLCGDAHKCLRQRRICFGLGVCIFVLHFWLWELCCALSDAVKLKQNKTYWMPCGLHEERCANSIVLLRPLRGEHVSRMCIYVQPTVHTSNLKWP
jgi:hypothetical protein